MKCKFCGTVPYSTVQENSAFMTTISWCPNCGAHHYRGYNKDAQRYYGHDWELPALGKRYFEMQDKIIKEQKHEQS